MDHIADHIVRRLQIGWIPNRLEVHQTIGTRATAKIGWQIRVEQEIRSAHESLEIVEPWTDACMLALCDAIGSPRYLRLRSRDGNYVAWIAKLPLKAIS